MELDNELVKRILQAASQQNKDQKYLTPWDHGITDDNKLLKRYCEELEKQGYLTGCHFGDGYNEPNPAQVDYVSVSSDHNIYLGQVTEKGQSLLESLKSMEEVD